MPPLLDAAMLRLQADPFKAFMTARAPYYADWPARRAEAAKRGKHLPCATEHL